MTAMTAQPEPPNSVEMAHPAPRSVLYLGRSVATAEALHSLLAGARPTSGSANGAVPADATAGAALTLDIVTNQKVALRHVGAQPPVLVLIETTSKPDSRLRFCQALRLRLPGVAIVAVVGGLDPAYDFDFDAQVRTPVEPAEALASLQVLRADKTQALIRRGPITLDMAGRRVLSPKGAREMTPKQCALLEMLMRNDRVVRRAEIMQTIWDTSYLKDTRTLDVHIHWLREMIEPEPAYPVYLLTQRGVGYRFIVPEEHP